MHPAPESLSWQARSGRAEANNRLRTAAAPRARTAGSPSFPSGGLSPTNPHSGKWWTA